MIESSSYPCGSVTGLVSASDHDPRFNDSRYYNGAVYLRYPRQGESEKAGHGYTSRIHTMCRFPHDDIDIHIPSF